MALIRKFVRTPGAHLGWRTEVQCGYSVGQVDDKRILHLETYGSSTRQRPGKVSQSLEFDEAAARELLHILRSSFPKLS